MAAHMRWSDLDSSIFTSEERASRKTKAIAEYRRELEIPELRRYRNVTQVDLAQKMKLSQSTVAGIEGRGDVQLRTLSRYINALGGELHISAIFPMQSSLSRCQRKNRPSAARALLDKLAPRKPRCRRRSSTSTRQPIWFSD